MTDRTNATAANRAAPAARSFQDLQAKSLLIPSRYGKSGAARGLRIQIIGGNPLASGIEAIQYAATVTMPKVYDPDVDTAYVAGLGNGWLFLNGIRQPNRVLVRHDFIGDQTPLITGRRVSVSGTVTLTHTAAGPPIVTTPMTVYLIDWL